MTLKKIDAYEVVCDGCGERLLDNDDCVNDYSIWTDEFEADQAANEQDWICRDGKHYCDICWHLDDEGNVIVDED